MPLPNNGVPWPPKTQQPIINRLNMWSAWYSGDPDRLGAVYGGAQSTGSLEAQQFSASEAGGFKGRVSRAWSRFWWGQPLPAGEKNTKLHIPLAADISSVSADLLYGEQLNITVEDPDTQERLEELIDEGDLIATLREGAELGSALGGIYHRICWDSEFADHPWIDTAHPDAAVPEWRYGRLYAVTFWKVIRKSDDGKVVIRHLERHEPEAILHGVYVGDSEQLGIRHPLTDFEETAYLAAGLVDGDVMPTGVKDLTACYIPNVKPNRCWRDLPQAAPLGRSDYQGVEPEMDALDEAWSSWMRDLRLGKARIIASKQMIESYGRGQAGRVDLDRELWTGVDLLAGKPGEAPLTEIQFQIRVAEHAQTTDALTEQIIRGSGYSLQSFGMQGEGATMQTATEVSAKQGRSASTRGRKIGYTTSPLAGLLETLLAIDADIFGSGVTPERPKIEFPDGTSPDPAQLATTLQAVATAKAASTQTLVQMLHPDWEKETVDEEVARIKGEQPKPVQLQPPPGGDANGHQASEAVRQQGPVAPVRSEPQAQAVLPQEGRGNNGNGGARNPAGQGRVPGSAKA